MCLILACSPFPFFSPIILLFPIPIILPPPSIFNHRLPILPPPYPPIPIPIFLLLILLARLTVVCAIYIWPSIFIYLAPLVVFPWPFTFAASFTLLRFFSYPKFITSRRACQETKPPFPITHTDTRIDTRRHTCRHTKTHADTHADTQRHTETHMQTHKDTASRYMYATSHSFFCPFHPFLHFDRSSVGGLVRNSHGMEIITTHCNYG